jgi:hypothetical protein
MCQAGDRQTLLIPRSEHACRSRCRLAGSGRSQPSAARSGGHDGTETVLEGMDRAGALAARVLGMELHVGAPRRILRSPTRSFTSSPRRTRSKRSRCVAPRSSAS